MNARKNLTPYMAGYDREFSDSGKIRWLPYLMYFHPCNYRSELVNTDHRGFRYVETNQQKFSVAEHDGITSAKLIVGSSTVFGIGASSDRSTLASCLTQQDEHNVPWLNFSGRSFNATQELLLMILYQHLLPKIEEIVIFSGFNDLGLARLPAEKRLDHGAFFNCNQFFERLNINEDSRSLLSKWTKDTNENSPCIMLTEQIDFATHIILKQLQIWRMLADSMQAKLTFILQPLSGWVREQGCQEEEQLFSELDRIGKFTEIYGDILLPDICTEYAEKLADGAKKIGVNFVNFSPYLSQTIAADQWLFVDRIHFTDQGHEWVAKKILDVIQ